MQFHKQKESRETVGAGRLQAYGDICLWTENMWYRLESFVDSCIFFAVFLGGGVVNVQ